MIFPKGRLAVWPSIRRLGTALGIVIGAVVMLIIGISYHYLMNRYPDSGGTLTYAAKTFGYDHGFLSSRFLMLVYIAIIWANATALALIARKLLGGAFQFGFHYQVLGYDVWLGEALLSAAAIVLCGFLCIRSKRLAAALQTVMAVVLFAGILVGFFAVTGLHRAGGLSYAPLFAPRRGTPAGQIFTIVVLAPWAFVGFESVSNSPSGFKFSPKKSIWIMLAALITGAASYLLLSLIAAALPPEGYAGWPEYPEDLDSLDGLSGLPTFFATHRALGEAGWLCSERRPCPPSARA